MIAAAATKCEATKAALAKLGAPKLIVQHLHCEALWALSAADDLRTPPSATYDTARLFIDAGAVEALLDRLEETPLPVLRALRQLAKSDVAVNRIRKANGAKQCKAILESCRRNHDVAVGALGLLRNLAGNDDAKDIMCKDGTVDALLAVAGDYPKDSVLREHALATLAQIALRKPKNAQLILQKGGASFILDTMRAHPAASNLQRQGALAIRNLVARLDDPESPRSSFLDGGAEGLLRNAALQSQANVDVAYAALRDLGIHASIQTFDKDGVVATPVSFGDKLTNFRPVFDCSDGDDLTDKIAQAQEHLHLDSNPPRPAIL